VNSPCHVFMAMKLCPAVAGPLAQVGLLDGVLRGERMRGIGQNGQQGRPVRDQGADVPGVRGEQAEAGDRAVAAGEQLDRSRAQGPMSAWRSSACTFGLLSVRPSSRVLRPRPRGS
jgi:hypothetical protein